ncbi:MAG TPA: VWA domain-containing protein [Thermoanaerobaculia bacterium]|nr:VWA domain-containing protein [Thermoanaerobaculia bacterium]
MPAAAARASFVAPILVLLLTTASLQAQQAMPRANESIDVSIVNVDVFVTDRKGNRVRGLTAADFEIRENGRPQPISNFAEYAPEQRRGSGADRRDIPANNPIAALAEAPQKRTIVIFVESTTLAPHRSKTFFDSLRQLVREHVRPGDSVAVVSWLRAALVRQDFTDDVESIVQSLDELEAEMTGVEESGADSLRRQQEFLDEFHQDLVEEGFPVNLARITSLGAMSAAQAELTYIRRKAIALKSFMENIAGFDGKKIVIMAMHRFGEYAGAQYFQGEVPTRDRGLLDTRRERESVIATANAHNITLYPVYPRGITSTPRANAEDSGGNIFLVDQEADLRRFAADDLSHLNESAALYEMAVATGGMSATGARNIAGLLPRVGDDLDSYYSLAYRAPATGRDDQRSIRVTTRNRDYVIRSRRQYTEKSDETRVRDLVTANLVQETPGGSLPIEVRVGKVTDTGNRHLVPLTIRVPVESLTAREDGSGSFSVYLASGGGFGILSEVERRGQAFTAVEAKAAGARTGYFTYEVTMRIDPDSYRIAVGVLDDVSKEFGVGRVAVALEATK